MSQSSQSKNSSELLSAGKKKRTRRLWTSRVVMLIAFIVSIVGIYRLLGEIILLLIGFSLLWVLYLRRQRTSVDIQELAQEEPPFFLKKLVEKLSVAYGISEPELIVTSDGELHEHLFVMKKDGDYYIGVSTVYLDLVSEDGIAAGLAHEFEHIINGDLTGGWFHRYTLEFYTNTVIFIIAIIGTEILHRLVLGFEFFQINPTLPSILAFGGGSIVFYFANKWEGRESERLADIGAMERIGAAKFGRGLVEQEIIYGIPVPERLRDKLMILRSTHPWTISRIQYAGEISNIPTEEIVDSIDLKAIQENAEKYSHLTPDIDE